MKERSLASRLLFLLAMLTVVLIGAYAALPPKKWQWIPAEDMLYHPYADDILGGASYAERLDHDDVHVRCRLNPTDTDVIPFCGFQIHLNPRKNPPAVDLRGYHTVLVDLQYTGGNRKLRFYLRDFEEGYSRPEDPINTSKYMSVYVPIADAESELRIGMNEFTVADWWVNDHDVPRAHSLQTLDSVVSFGIDVAYPAALGHHELKLNSVTFVGDWVSAENWYLGILWCWIGGLFIAGVVKLYEFRRLAAAERRERAKLEEVKSSLQQEKEQYQELSKTDQLSGLLNRHGLLSFYAECVRHEESRPPTSMMVVDIDHFKPINDTFGHNAGDSVLRRIATIITSQLRQSDRASRWGGEEFVVLLPGTSAEAAAVLAERLRRSIQNVTHAEAGGLSITVSIGVGEFKSGELFESAFFRIDAALYQAKHNGRNRVAKAD